MFFFMYATIFKYVEKFESKAFPFFNEFYIICEIVFNKQLSKAEDGIASTKYEIAESSCMKISDIRGATDPFQTSLALTTKHC